MKKLLVFVALVGPAWCSYAQDPDAVSAERARITAERSRADAAFTAQEKVCYGKFAVNDCIDTARAKRREAMAELRRQEIALNGRTIAMASAPGGGTLFTADGDSPLDHATRLGVERSTMRNPVVLLKSRLGRGFSAEVQGTEEVDGETVDRLRLTQQDNETVLLVARKNGRLVEIRYDLIAAGAGKRSVTVRFSDWKTGSSGLRYPHVARGREEGNQVFEVVTKSFEVDAPLSETLFSAGSDSAGFGVTPVR